MHHSIPTNVRQPFTPAYFVELLVNSMHMLNSKILKLVSLSNIAIMSYASKYNYSKIIVM